MPRDGSGAYTSPSNSWNAAVEGTTIDESDWNDLRDDLETALSDSLAANGEKIISAYLDFDENASPGTPASNDGRLYAFDVGGVTHLAFKDSAGTVRDLCLPADGVPYVFNSTTTTTSDPGANNIAFNNATPASVTEIAIDDLDAHGEDLSAWIATWDDNTGGKLIIRNRVDGNVIIYTVSGASTDESGWTRLAVTHVAGMTNFSNSDPLFVMHVPAGPTGATGATGATGTNGATAGVTMAFSSDTTTTSDPGSGNFEFNNATVSSVTEIAIDDNSAETGNPAIDSWVATFDDSSSTTKGILTFRHKTTPETFAIFTVSSLTDATTHHRVGVTHVQSNGTFTDTEEFVVDFTPNGDAGAGSNSFETIDCPSGTDPVAASATDTLSLAAGGAYITITGDSGTDTVTFDLSQPLQDVHGLSVTDGNFIVGDGVNWVAESGATARTSLGLANALLSDTDANVTAGYTGTADNDGSQSSGTYTPDPAGGNLKRITNDGAFTLAAPSASNDYTMVIQLTNGASAGSVTTSGFEAETGDSLTTTNGDDFFLYITKINGFQHLHITALQ